MPQLHDHAAVTGVDSDNIARTSESSTPRSRVVAAEIRPRRNGTTMRLSTACRRRFRAATANARDPGNHKLYKCLRFVADNGFARAVLATWLATAPTSLVGGVGGWRRRQRQRFRACREDAANRLATTSRPRPPARRARRAVRGGFAPQLLMHETQEIINCTSACGLLPTTVSRVPCWRHGWRRRQPVWLAVWVVGDGANDNGFAHAVKMPPTGWRRRRDPVRRPGAHAAPCAAVSRRNC